ncbi:MAG: glycosylasparaginase precursor [Acidobacteriaceae bacterium]|jgi:N4-(beta-N-acetylglucosaminyl)-L-asparaginase|nr:glycosylasparaginase precursor [Acidobacteriaceae bacterium]
MVVSRRGFIATAIAGSLSLGLQAQQDPEQNNHEQSNRKSGSGVGTGKRPILICAGNGFPYIDDAYNFLKNGGDTLDAALRVVKGPEDDPNDTSVGLGGLPNEEGIVELDACCMHGPTRRAGSVGGVRNIKNVSQVAKAVMEHTGHVMLVGEGAERFAVDEGFPRENLLTDNTRKIWLLWKETHSDWWGSGLADPQWKKRLSRSLAQKTANTSQPKDEWQLRIDRMEMVAADLGIAPEERMAAIRKVLFPPTGTIHCSTLNNKGEMSGCTTTSGLAWKLPGRCGDSPIIGAGCYTDQDVGSAGATGSGEENIKVAGAHAIIENMRHGMSPLDAGRDALKRIVRNYNGDMERLKFIDMTYYILRKDGAYAGVSLWEGYETGKPHRISVHDGTRRNEKTVNLFPGVSQEWPPTPST